MPVIRAVDLFCGVGGLTYGLAVAGIDVRLGIDIDPEAEFPYTMNNRASFLLKSVTEVTATELDNAFGTKAIKLLAGCAPCQAFSTYSQGRAHRLGGRWTLLEHFLRLALECRPQLLTMENVPPLQREPVFDSFVAALKSDGYKVFKRVVNCADYGVPQQRQRLVLLASRLGEIRFVDPTTPEGRRRTVRDAIGHMPALEAGEACREDRLHCASRLAPVNLKRIRASKPGGSWRDWDKDLRAPCHTRESGRSYPAVYGRMAWGEPSPTMTTQFYGFGNGRFGHPEQDRAISLREGAILQSFPQTYEFARKDDPVARNTIGRLVGNAVPVKLAVAIGKSLVDHVTSLRPPETQT